MISYVLVLLAPYQDPAGDWQSLSCWTAMKLLQLLLLALNYSAVHAVICYYASSSDTNYKPTASNVVNCVNATQCYKRTVYTDYYPNMSGEAHPNTENPIASSKGVYYGCYNATTGRSVYAGSECYGIDNGQCKSTKKDSEHGIGKTKTCCCGTDYCNSVGYLSIFPVAISMLYTMF